MINISDEAETAITVVLTAGKKLKTNFGKTAPDRNKTDSAADVVTKLDVETENFISESLRKKYPSIGFKGEESGRNNVASERIWLADPIDGTAYFVRGIPGCTTMLALIENGQVKIGIIYDFVKDDLYFAERGRGAFLNKNPIHVSDRLVKDSLISLECNINDTVLSQFLALQKNYTIVDAGYPSGMQHTMVARGQIEGRICLNAYGRDYDFAPGSLLVQEAGGRVANIGKTTYSYTELNFLAVNKNIFESLTTGENPIFPIRE